VIEAVGDIGTVEAERMEAIEFRQPAGVENDPGPTIDRIETTAGGFNGAAPMFVNTIRDLIVEANFHADVTFREPMFAPSGPLSGSRVLIGLGLLPDAALRFPAGGLSERVVVNASDDTGVWDGIVTVGDPFDPVAPGTTLGGAGYAVASAELGAGSVGVVPYALHDEDCVPPNHGAPVIATRLGTGGVQPFSFEVRYYGELTWVDTDAPPADDPAGCLSPFRDNYLQEPFTLERRPRFAGGAFGTWRELQGNQFGVRFGAKPTSADSSPAAAVDRAEFIVTICEGTFNGYQYRLTPNIGSQTETLTCVIGEGFPSNISASAEPFVFITGPIGPGTDVEDACSTDFDGDGMTATSDLLLLLAGYGLPVDNAGQLGDADGDGLVGTSDLLALLSVFGCPCTGCDGDPLPPPPGMLGSGALSEPLSTSTSGADAYAGLATRAEYIAWLGTLTDAELNQHIADLLGVEVWWAETSDDE
jgi:hypothetical protein